jgi:ABC-type branched-subunit amino acid transport system ATPase component
MLSAIHLSKNFGGVMAVRDCDFEVKQGKITALIGPNGSGKSTFFNLVSGILKPSSGRIIFNDTDITGMRINKISNLGISRVFQQSRIFNNLSVEDNLILACDNEDTKFFKNLIFSKKGIKEKKEKAKEMLKLVGMEEFKDRKAGELSFGQKRLIEISRAVLNPHKLLMLDEPVAGVTPPLREKIADFLINLNKKGETILLIEHDMLFTFKIAQWIIVLDQGRVIAQGKPEEIKKDERVLEAYFGE